jgi:hypothetical protein
MGQTLEIKKHHTRLFRLTFVHSDYHKNCFDEGITVEDFVAHRAKWHKSCSRKFAKDKLHRDEQKRELTLDVPGSATDEKRRKDRQILPKYSCIFYGKQDCHFHEFRTVDADKNIRRIATDLKGETHLQRFLAVTSLLLKQNTT